MNHGNSFGTIPVGVLLQGKSGEFGFAEGAWALLRGLLDKHEALPQRELIPGTTVTAFQARLMAKGVEKIIGELSSLDDDFDLLSPDVALAEKLPALHDLRQFLTQGGFIFNLPPEVLEAHPYSRLSEEDLKAITRFRIQRWLDCRYYIHYGVTGSWEWREAKEAKEAMEQLIIWVGEDRLNELGAELERPLREEYAKAYGPAGECCRCSACPDGPCEVGERSPVPYCFEPTKEG